MQTGEARMTVGVVIPTYNSARFVKEAIDSVLSQKPSPDQLVVVDDGSTDDTSSVLKKYRDHLEHVQQPNRGPSAARNRGWTQLRTDAVAFLDADDLLLPGGLAIRLGLLTGEKAAWAYTEGLLQDATGTRWPFSKTYPPVTDLDRNSIFTTLLCRNFITASAMIVRREALQSVGGFDESIKGTEDWDLAIRLATQGPARYGPEPTFVQRLSSVSLSRNRNAMDRMRYITLRKIYQFYPEQVHAAGASARRSVADAHNYLGYSLTEEGRWAEARDFLLASLRLWPWQRRASWLLLLSLLRSGLTR